MPDVRPLRPAEFREKSGTPGTVILSIRDVATFGGAHIPGSIHIDISSNFSTFAGWVLPPDDDILLVADNPTEVKEAVLRLRRVGLDRTIGYLVGGIHAWSIAGYPIDHVRQLSPSETHEMVKAGTAVLVDVRFPDEYEEHHIEGAVNIPAMDLRTRHPELPTDRPLIVICRTGQRSSLASSLLKRAGFTEVYNAAGGVTGYLAAGYS